MHKDKFSLYIDYSAEKRERLKLLCGFLGLGSIRNFATEALDNEVDYRISKMTSDEKAAFEAMEKKRLAK